MIIVHVRHCTTNFFFVLFAVQMSPYSHETGFSDLRAMHQIQAQSTIALSAAAMHTVQRSEDSRNENTSKAYGPKQTEFRNWCKGINNDNFRAQDAEQAKELFDGYVYPDKDSVTDQKLNLFLTQRVINRPKRSGGKKRSRNGSNKLSYLLFLFLKNIL